MLRVILDFTDIETINEKFVWFGVDTFKLFKITDLKEVVCQKFNVTGIQLYVKNALLRDEDTICIIRDEDIIRVVQWNSSDNKLQKLSSFVQCNLTNECTSGVSTKRLKESTKCSDEALQNKSDNAISYYEENVEPAGINGKRKKPKKVKLSEKASDIPCGNKNEIICASRGSLKSESMCDMSIIETASELTEQSLFSVSNIENDNFHSTVCNDDNINTSVISVDNSVTKKKRRRQRCRKRNRKNSLIISSQDTFEIAETSNNFVPVENSPLSVNKKESKHIKFLLSDDSNDSNEIINESVIDFSSSNKSSLSALFKNGNGRSNVKINGQEESFQDNSLLLGNSSPKLLNNCNSLPSSGLMDQSEKSKEEILISNKYKSLTVLPKIGTQIAYKVLELNDVYCPEVSEFKEGIVKDIDSRGNITIELLKQEVKQARSGKFEVEFKNEEEEESPIKPEITSTAIVNWSNVIEPHILLQPNQ